MIKHLTVNGLRGLNSDKIDILFQPGLNLITGKNGSGKTTLLKLMWYLISGNLDKATDETRFANLQLETDEYYLEVQSSGNRADKIKLSLPNGKSFDLVQDLDEDGDAFPFDNIEEEANGLLVRHQKSVFFPTFRRLEGGYGIVTGGRSRTSRQSDIESSFEGLSRELSNSGHRFVAHVSTSDIAKLLLEKYTQISAEINKLQSELSRSIIDQIKSYQLDDETDPNGARARTILEDVKQTIEHVDRNRAAAFQPLAAIESVVSDIFIEKSIKIGSALNFGDAAQAISSEHLSAGEKQMLSFICYNALYRDAVFFIDEPELSLHPDWQRILFRVLEAQESGNQFIVCTHSPFIYSKFPEREIQMSRDRGDGLD